MGLSAAAEWLHAEVPLTRGRQTNVAINGSGATNDTDIPCGGDSTLVVEVDMTAAASGDLSVSVFPFEADGITIMPIVIPAVQSIGPTLSGGHDYYYGQYDVTALDKVRLRITNNNAGAQTITRSSWRLA